ncbi:MAG: hypothetical protein LBL91_01055 [Lachnospiraceae bacterium]|jgi:hypothetical protein|nr:hypothetical protein [Lachnospiraceae bacterium]
MKKIVSVTLACILVLVGIFTLTGCDQADKVSQNISKEADNFNVIRRLTVINLRSDKPVFELVAAFSIVVDNADQQLEVTCEVGEGTYRKHFIDIHPTEIMYFVEDVSESSVSKYHYEVNFQPQSILPVILTVDD